MCDAYAFDFSVFCKADAFLFGDGGAVGKLVAGDASAAFYKSYDFFGIAFGLAMNFLASPAESLVYRMFSVPYMSLILLVAELGVVIWLSTQISRMAAGTGRVKFIAWS